MSTKRGSEWNKWDLHIHSKYSSEERAKMDIQTIFEKAINAGISVISITDHSNFDGLDEIWEYWKNGEINFDGSIVKISDKIEFLPGIELKASSGKRGIHFIAIFPKEIVSKRASKDFLKSDFLSKIDCSQTDIEKAGGGEYNKGLFEISVNFESTCNKVHELGGLIIVHAGYDKDHSIEKEVAHHADDASEDEILNSLGPLKEKYMEECIDICELTNWSDKSLKQKEFYYKTFKKPTVVFSDSHESFDGSKFTWVKSEMSIEGFKQILFEPIKRVFLGENKPFYPTIWLRKAFLNFPEESILNDEKICFAGKHEINFSPYFNCFIGGRGTGKSTIINLINEKVAPGLNVFFKDKRLVEQPTGSKIIIDQHVDIGTEIDSKHIEFINQNEIEKFATDNEALTTAIYNRIKKLDIDGTLEKYEIQIENASLTEEGYVNNILNRNSKTITLQEKEKELGTYKSILESHKSDSYNKLTTAIKELSSKVIEFKQSKENYSSLINSIQVLIDKFTATEQGNAYDHSINDVVSKLSQIYSDTQSIDFSESIVELHQKEIDLNIAKLALSEYLKEMGVSQDSLNDISAANTKIGELETEIELLAKELTALTLTISSYNSQEIVVHGESYFTSISEKIENINLRLSAINNAQIKSITLKYEFDLESAKEGIFNDFYTLNKDSIIELSVKETSLWDVFFALEPTENTELEKYLKALGEYPSQSKAKQWLMDLYSKDDNYEILLSIIRKHISNSSKYKRIKVYYDDRKIEDTSFGQRCTATLVILLYLGNYPIIIDEPEAHLDSLLISNYLVDLIKEKKVDRQIIFATHNANFVINGDAEFIHILNMTPNKVTELTSTTIENRNTRGRLIGLEGGKEAFLKRENKYFLKEI